MLDSLRKLLGRGAEDVIHGAQAIGRSNPLVPQQALSPESLNPNQKAGGYSAPYNVNGKQQTVGWGIQLPQEHPTAPMPQLLGQPDWSAGFEPNYDHPSYPVDGSFMRTNILPRVQYIKPGITNPVWTSENDGDPVRYPRFQS